MKKKSSIQIKALFMLLVFSVNTMVGFACSLGLDMGFNARHHHEEEIEAAVHVHANGKKHVHHEEAAKEHHNEASDKSQDEKDNCCHNKVVKIDQQDKAIAKTVTYNVPLSYPVFTPPLYNINFLFYSQQTPAIKYFVRSYHPPIPDIRIAIRSFQI